MFEFVLLDSHQCNRFLGEPAMSNFYPRLPRKSRLKLYKARGRPLCNDTVNSYRGCIAGGLFARAAIASRQGEICNALKVLAVE
jgi:hypothetical protein